ncbi:hypothetical protein LUW77_26020 [Streptomyces radiopugnans]|nr:hypothetical protein LUW77_26020 [Streptomyces radiopugnans]
MSDTTTTATAEPTLSPAEMAPYIQHTRIDPDATRDDMVAHAREAVAHGFNAAMVPASWVPVVAAELRGTGIEVASALDFPTVGVMTSAKQGGRGRRDRPPGRDAARHRRADRLAQERYVRRVPGGHRRRRTGLGPARQGHAGTAAAHRRGEGGRRRTGHGGGRGLPEERQQRADRDRESDECSLPCRPGTRRRSGEGLRVHQELPSGPGTPACRGLAARHQS